MRGDVTAAEPDRRDEPTGLAERLDLLFDKVRQANGKKYSNTAVADVVGCHREYISALRNGKRDNPTQDVLKALAAFFDVSPAYFFDDERSREIAGQIELATQLRDPATRSLALSLLRETNPADAPLIAEVVRGFVQRPELREVLTLALSCDDADLKMIREVMHTILTRRQEPAG